MHGADPRLALPAVRARYNDPTRFRSIDVWHRFTARQIRREIERFKPFLPLQGHGVILNAGSGDDDLGLPATTINLDLSDFRVSRLPNAIIGSVEAIPLAAKSVDLITCVGSVINYCDAAAAIAELGRVLRPGGHLVLEFDSSQSAELLPQPAFGRTAAVAETFYAHEDEAVWVYTPRYIKNLLAGMKLSVRHAVPIQVLSPWALLLFRSSAAASIMARLDRAARCLPLLSYWASNHLFFCEKGT